MFRISFDGDDECDSDKIKKVFIIGEKEIVELMNASKANIVPYNYIIIQRYLRYPSHFVVVCQVRYENNAQHVIPYSEPRVST